MSADEIAPRLKEVRAATGLKQSDFAAKLAQAAKRLYGGQATRYDQPMVSSLENAGRDVTLQDVAVYAAIDPERRGKLWLGWNESVDASMARPQRHGPSIIQQPTDEHLNQPVRVAGKSARKRGA